MLSNGAKVFVEQAQGGVLNETFGVGAGVGGDLREPRFLLGCEMDFHALRILEKRLSGNGVERAGPGLRYPAGCIMIQSWEERGTAKLCSCQLFGRTFCALIISFGVFMTK
jgi:hypothetical protein